MCSAGDWEATRDLAPGWTDGVGSEAVHLEAEHLCTQMRGVREEHSKTVTSVWRRGYTDNPELRREFLAELSNRNPRT